MPLTDQALQAMHGIIAQRLAEDDAADRDVIGIRGEPEWKAQAEEFEAELRDRGLAFTPINWEKPQQAA